MNLELMDFTRTKVSTPVDLDKLDEISIICIEVNSGDEIAHVHFKDGRSDVYDSSDSRVGTIYYGTYLIYSDKLGINLIDEFVARNDYYDMVDKYDMIEQLIDAEGRES